MGVDSEMVKLNTPPNGDSDKPRVFDELSEQIFGDARRESTFLDWHLNYGTNPGTIYNWCDKLGVDRVKAHMREAKIKRGISNKGAWLFTVLENLIKSEGKKVS